MKKLLVIEGEDRSGKDHLATRILMSLPPGKAIILGHPTPYDVSRRIFSSDNPNLACSVSDSFAISEFCHTIQSMFIDFADVDHFILVRSFLSTIVYNRVRNEIHLEKNGGAGLPLNSAKLKVQLDQIRFLFPEFEMNLVEMFASKEIQLSRGSKPDSFEIVNKDLIETSFVEEADKLRSKFFKSTLTLATDSDEESEINFDMVMSIHFSEFAK